QQRISQQQVQVRHVEVVNSLGWQLLEEPHEVIAQIADQAACEAGQPIHGHRPVSLEEFPDGTQRIRSLVSLWRPAGALDGCGVTYAFSRPSVLRKRASSSFALSWLARRPTRTRYQIWPRMGACSVYAS